MYRIGIAALFTVLVAGMASAGTISQITSVTGATTSTLNGIGNHALPYTDSNGVQYSTLNSADAIYGYGLQSLASPSNTISVVLPSAATEVGFDFFYAGAGVTVQSVTLGSDTTTAFTPTITPSGIFLGFADTVSFTNFSLTLTAGGSNIVIISDFKFGTAPSSSVPEPSTFANVAMAAVVGLGTLAARRRRVEIQA